MSRSRNYVCRRLAEAYRRARQEREGSTYGDGHAREWGLVEEAIERSLEALERLP